MMHPLSMLIAMLFVRPFHSHSYATHQSRQLLGITRMWCDTKQGLGRVEKYRARNDFELVFELATVFFLDFQLNLVSIANVIEAIIVKMFFHKNEIFACIFGEHLSLKKALFFVKMHKMGRYRLYYIHASRDKLC